MRIYCRKRRLNIEKKTGTLLNGEIKTGLDAKPNTESDEIIFTSSASFKQTQITIKILPTCVNIRIRMKESNKVKNQN